jgi:hypothetical protein
VQGLALVDSRDGTFQTLVPGAYRLIYSGDVKIYENLDVLPRAFLVDGWQWQPDINASVTAMANVSFDPAATAILVGEGEPVSASSAAGGRVEVVGYGAERVALRTESNTDALLVLTDAFYPGWQARLNGKAARIYQADGMFRAVFVPAGRHEVVFTYAPELYLVGRRISVLACLLWAVLFVVVLTRR